MQSSRVTVRWPHGLHMLPASRLVRLCKGFRATLRLALGAKVADTASVLSLLVLGAAAGSTLVIEAHGEDEGDALAAVVEFFENDANG